MKLDIEARVEHGYANSNGVRIHYATLGTNEKPLIVLIHVFPDFWYSWIEIMDLLSTDYYVVAIDQRGYNLSDKPKGEENYNITFLVNDVISVVHHLGFKKSIIVGHDCGGVVAWVLAMRVPQLVEKLIILNLPHPRGLRNELATNPLQQKASQYARDYRNQPEAYKSIKADELVTMFRDKEIKGKEKYIEALNRSDFEAMLNYYKQNYPKDPYTADTSELIKVKASVLMIHGLNDICLLSGALNNTWEWLESDLTLVTIPNAGHFVHHDQPDIVKRTIKMWLNR